ncbi:MAG: hypothetical protein IKM26_01245 [Clostridia bacterium]|nr:hypothetical protein [Clostridia bacterium]
MERKYVLGLDGGGTKTDIVLCQTDGQIVAKIKAGPSSMTGQRVEAVRSCLQEALDKIIPYKEGVIGCFAGISGAGLTANRKRYLQIFSDIFPLEGRIDVGSDAVNMLCSGIGNRDGMVAIAGTGACVYARKAGVMHRVDGWGYLLGDRGSGFMLGRRALVSALRALDGVDKKTLLTEMCEKKCGMPLADFVSEIYRMNAKTVIADFAPVLLEAAGAGDEIAMRELDDVAAGMAENLRTAAAISGSREVVLGGSVWKSGIYQQYVKAHLNGEWRFTLPKLAPVYGAVIAAMGIAGLAVDCTFAENFERTYQEGNK